jgi:general secretion pathway protein C
VQKPDTIIVKLGPNMPKTCPDLAGQDASPTPQVPPAQPTPALADAELDAGIKVIDATHRTITRALLERVMAEPMELAKSARIVPSQRNGKPNGVKLYAIRPKGILARLGFLNSDTLLRINGRDLSAPEKALEIYAALRDANELAIEMERAGKPLTLTVTIIK